MWLVLLFMHVVVVIVVDVVVIFHDVYEFAYVVGINQKNKKHSARHCKQLLPCLT